MADLLHFLGCGIGKAVCSNCNKIIKIQAVCPNCGAKFENEEKRLIRQNEN